MVVLGFAAWRILGANGSDSASTTPVALNPDGTPVASSGTSSSGGATGGATAGGPPQPDVDFMVDAPAYNEATSVSPFRSVLTKINTESHPTGNVGPLPVAFGDGQKPPVIKEKPRFVLQGVITGKAAPMAIIADGDKPPRIVWRGARLADGSRVEDIREDRVLLRRGHTTSVLHIQVVP